MDITVIRQKLTGWGKKYKYVVVILAVGMVLMLLPTEKKVSDQPLPSEATQENTELGVTAGELEEVLRQIKGAGEVDVLLTYAVGQRKVFHANERSTTSEGGMTQESDIVLISDSNRSEEALVSHVLAPEYLGAVIVCQGAEDPSVKLAVSEAVSKATGLGTDRISVLKMK